MQALPGGAARCDGALYAAAALHPRARLANNRSPSSTEKWMTPGVQLDHLRALGLLAFIALLCPTLSVAAGPQEKVAKAYLEAAAAGQPEALLEFLHPGEVQDLRNRLLKALDDEQAHGSHAARERLFGNSSMDEIRGLTPNNLFVTVARRLGLPTERVGEIKVLGTVEENSQLSHVVARISPPEDSDQRSRVALVSLIRYGKDWRVQIPYAIQARLDAAMAAPENRTSGAGKGKNTPEIVAFLNDGETTLKNGDCAGFFNEHMSPNFRDMHSAKALQTLIEQCKIDEDTRETYISALELARRMSPAFEQNGARAIYDLRGQGLPFDRFVLEKVDEHWYVAE